MFKSPTTHHQLRRMALWAALAACAAGSLSAAEPAQAAPSGDEIPLTIGKSIVLDIPDEIQRVAITDDEVADAIAISTREVLINAKAEGVTTLVLWSRAGDRNFFTITVGSNIRQLQDHIRAAFPDAGIRCKKISKKKKVNFDMDIEFEFDSYKHAISTVVPARNVKLASGSEEE